jgi:hypothetical protein
MTCRSTSKHWPKHQWVLKYRARGTDEPIVAIVEAPSAPIVLEMCRQSEHILEVLYLFPFA